MLVWIGGGLGMAAFLGGKVHRGAVGAAGEIGYLPVPGAPLPEDVGYPGQRRPAVPGRAAPVRALAEVFGFGKGGVSASVRAAVEQSGGSERARAFLDEIAHRVALGVVAVCVVLDPGLIVLGGDVGMAGGAALADRVAAEVSRMCPVRPRVVPTAVRGARPARRLLTAVSQARVDLLASVAG